MPGVKLRLSKARPNRKEGVEAEIRKDLSALARNRAVSDAVIVSAEEDLAPVIAEVQDLGIRAILLHISADGNWAISRSLRQECDDIIDIAAGHLRPYVDLIPGAEPVSADAQLSGSSYRELPVSAAAASPAATSSIQPAAAGYRGAGPAAVPVAGRRRFRPARTAAGSPRVSRDQQPVLPPQEPARFSGPAGADAGRIGPAAARTSRRRCCPSSSRPAIRAVVRLAQSGYGQNGFGGDAGHASNGQGRARTPLGCRSRASHGDQRPNGMPPIERRGPADRTSSPGLPPAAASADDGPAQNGDSASTGFSAERAMPARQNGLSQNGLQPNGMPTFRCRAGRPGAAE